MSERRAFCVITSTLCLVLLLPAVAAAQYTRDEVFAKLRLEGLSRGDVASLVEGMPRIKPSR